MGNFKISDATQKKERNPDLDESQRFNDCINQIVTITGVQFIKIGEINWAIMETNDGKVSSSGKVVVEQLEAIQSKLDAGDTTKVRLIMKKGKYHYLEDAE